MGNKVTDELVATVRSIVGSEYSEMDIVRALHMANNDATAAINIIFDTPNFKSKGGLGLPKKPELSCRNSSSEPRPTVANTKQNGYESEKRVNCCSGTEDNGRDCPSKSGDELVEDVCQRESSFGSEWWLVGCGELAGLSTCKGRRIKPGDEVVFAFPASSASNSPSPGKVFGRGRHVVSCSEIVRFSTRDSGEVCSNSLLVKSLVVLTVKNYLNVAFLVVINVLLQNLCTSIVQFLASNTTPRLRQPALLLRNQFSSTPNIVSPARHDSFQEEFTPSDLYTRRFRFKVESEEFISDADLENIVGFRDSSELEEMEPLVKLLCELRQYQKQALYWMVQLERDDSWMWGNNPSPLLGGISSCRQILADAMGLGKTIMTIALLLDNSEGGGSSVTQPTNQSSTEGSEVGNVLDNSLNISKRSQSFQASGSRPKDAKSLAQSNVVITTYGVLASEFSTENAEDNGGLYSVRWFRIVLDEAHTIKSSRSQISMAATALVADRLVSYWNPIQNKLEDIYSLLGFESGTLGPILVLPPADSQVIYCELTEAERDFYDALFKRSKVKFDQFVEQGRVLHNYASILELLLRLRQCCDHPFLVMSRGDTQEFSDLNKLARHFLKGSQNSAEGEAKDQPSRAYVQEVLEELCKGEQGECPICLEAFEDAVLTPCAHRICRECLLASWRNATSGLCPVCRKVISRQDLITAPTESRFKVDIDKNWVESSKVVVLLRELETLKLVRINVVILSRNNIPFLRLDGTLNQQQRENLDFTGVWLLLHQVLLMSLKAGGVGINLTAASNAFVLDPWWNPAVEEQAVMRIHRIGQTKRVMIKRFIVKGTVEERMEAVQARKQRMISGALTDQEVRSARIEELKMLFT
ncbi:hypothetical protein FNV43_RR03535 [Rhamnella rubrinervis]|uniref:Uncharacterized protein n=1 Tax=Rhamnella rubrinervis TaxID=2594499 RepID=A0A8K0HIK8_9ROSA|nr:hypothetical protein FNV43_RR03535 [Rhamnella rubrinervis]